MNVKVVLFVFNLMWLASFEGFGVIEDVVGREVGGKVWKYEG